jgi:transcriptional regulator of acetoin/glycerol metabolism
VNARLSDLSACRLDQLLPKALERLRGATLEELAELLGRSTSSSVAPPSADALARAVLALPGTGSKLRAAERAVILHALDVCNGNVSATGRLLGIDRKALERKIRRMAR